MKLYSYQREAVDKLKRRIFMDWDDGQSSKQILKAPTGAGKI